MGVSKPQRVLKQNLQRIRSQRYNDQWKKSLNLSNCSNQWLDLLQNENWTQLEQLVLSDCRVNDSEIEKLLKLKWPQLSILWINKNMLTSKGVSNLIYYHIPSLKTLSLASNKIGSKGVKYLVKANFIHLQQLWIYNCEIGQCGAKNLIKGQWPSLKILNLEFNKIANCVHQALVDNNFNQLTTVYMGNVLSLQLMRLVLCRKFVLFANADVDLNKNGRNAKIIIKTVCAILENKEKSG